MNEMPSRNSPWIHGAATRLPFVKVCCIASIAEAAIAVQSGASAIGLVSAMPSGPGPIDELLIAEIAAWAPPPVATFLLTARQDASGIVEQHNCCRTTTIQLVDAVPLPELRALRVLLPGVKLVQVIHVTDEGSVEEALSVAALVDALLLDSGNPKLPVKELGGTGRTHDWVLSRRIRDRSPVPVFLAGGLHDGNVGDAIRSVAPYGLDLCSGVRTEGRLDEEKLSRFMAATRRGLSTAP